MKLDGIIFDIDGILVDVSKSYREAIRLTASYFLDRNVTKSEVDKIKSIVGMNNDWDAAYSLINQPELPYKDVRSYFQSIYLGTANNKGLIEKEKLLISYGQLSQLLKKYKQLAIASGRPKIEAEYVLKKNNINKFFEYIVAMEDVKKGKPAPDMILKIINKLNLKNTVYIGDSPSDVLASENANIKCLYVGEQKIGAKQFKSVKQLLKYLL